MLAMFPHQDVLAKNERNNYVREENKKENKEAKTEKGLFHAEASLQRDAREEGYRTVDVTAENVPVSTMSGYKDMDYSFLKSFQYGKHYDGKITAKIITAVDMIACEDIRVKANAIIRTGGYYEAGDGGSGIYEITEKAEAGSILLENGLYATLRPDVVEIDGKKWAIVSANQFGVCRDGSESANAAISQTVAAANAAAGLEQVDRAIAYFPEGEYKCTTEVQFNATCVNIVGDGDGTVFFTDNDYSTWWEFFMWACGAKDLYIGNFKVEAREVDMSKYYRQFVFVDCDNVYMYQVKMVVPQEAFSMDYFVDKQYTNLTFYSGNKNMTVDSCYMEQMCSTYRGANLGILDFYCRGEENITIMNCEMHDNARDEQTGIFTGNTNRDASFIKNVYYINNDVNIYTPLDKNAAGGHRTMCFTVAYNMSKNIENIRIAGNHFKCETDSKFMTFGNVENCVVENNIIEADCTSNLGSYVFEGGAMQYGDVKIRNNEIYITREGKGSICSGELEFTGNRVVADAPIGSVMYQEGTVENNTFVTFRNFSNLANNSAVIRNNRVDAYGGFGGFLLVGGNKEYTAHTAYIQNNYINDYRRRELLDYKTPFESVGTMRGSYTAEMEVTGNQYYSPNMYLSDGKGTQVARGLFYSNGTNNMEKVTIADNIFQQIDGYRIFGSSIHNVSTWSNNTILPYNEFKPEEQLYKQVSITKNGEDVKEIYTTEDQVALDTNVAEEDANWYTSIQSIATVDKGVVTRKQYGEVDVFLAPSDGSVNVSGSALYAKCTVHFQKQAATGIQMQTNNLTLQPGKKKVVVYTVTPKDKVSQKLLWSSSNEEVATVSQDGIIEALAEGIATITARTDDGSNLEEKITVNVAPLTVKKIDLNTTVWDNDQAGLKIGDKKQFSVASYTPADATNKGISRWESTNEKVVTVDENGMATVVGGGHAEIRGYSMDEYCYGSCTVWVNPEPIQNLQQSHTNNSFTLTWDPQEGVDGYRVFRYEEEKQEWVVKTEQKGTSYTVYASSVGGYADPDTEYKMAVAAYSKRRNPAKYNEYIYYENRSTTISFRTYKDKVVTNFGYEVPYTMGLSVGKSTTFSVHVDKDKVAWEIADPSIATVEDISQGGSPKLQITGVKEGFTCLTLKALDEMGYEQKIPIYIHDFETFDLELEGGIKSITAKWQVERLDEISGFRFIRSWVIADAGIDIPISEISTHTVDGKTQCSYTFEGLKNNTAYGLVVKPYITKEEVHYSGGGSKKVIANTVEYVNIEDIQMDSVIWLKKGEQKEISLLVTPGNATEPNLNYKIYDRKIAAVVATGATVNSMASVVVEGKAVGATELSAIACDDQVCSVTGMLVVLPEATVTGLQGICTKEQVELNWNNIQEPVGYRIYRRKAQEEQWTHLGDTKENSYVDSFAQKNTEYVYKVVLCVMDTDRELWEGDSYAEVAVSTEALLVEHPTPAPSNVPGSEENGNEENPTGTGTQAPTLSSGQNTGEVSVASIESGTNGADHTIQTKAGTVQAPKNFKVKKETKHTITLQWKSVKGVSGYELYEYKNKKWKKRKSLTAAKTKVTIKNCKPGRKYIFRLRSVQSSSDGMCYSKMKKCVAKTKK